jgi:hypothetical protein
MQMKREGEVGRGKGGKRDVKEKKEARESGSKRCSLVILDRWDKKKDSLSSTLHGVLPKKFPKTDSPPIPSHPPNTNQEILIDYFGNLLK